jgi:hypothetical protein
MKLFDKNKLFVGSADCKDHSLLFEIRFFLLSGLEKITGSNSEPSN